MVAKVKNRCQSVKKETFLSFLSKKLVMVSIQKFRIIVFVSNQIEYWTIQFEISNIRTALAAGHQLIVLWTHVAFGRSLYETVELFA